MSARYFQDEMLYLRDLARDFALHHPALAPLLAERSTDPDVERLLEGVAFLTARIRERIDGGHGEVVHALSSFLAPSVLRPTPCCTVLEVIPAPSALRERVTLEKGTEYASVPVDGVECRFAAAWPMDLVPWTSEGTKLESLPGGGQVLRLGLRGLPNVPLAAHAPERLRLFIDGDARTQSTLLLWLHEHLEDVVLEDADGARPLLSLGRGAVSLVGFEDDAALLPEADDDALGFALLRELSVLPEKLAFFDVAGLARLAALPQKPHRIVVALRFRAALPPETRVEAGTLKLHCVPIVNVFRTGAVPLGISPSRQEYVLRPDGLSSSQGDVFAVLSMTGILRGGARVPVTPFFSYHGAAGATGARTYVLHQRPTTVGDSSETLASFWRPKEQPPVDLDVVSIDLLATNRSLPQALRAGDIRVATQSSPAFATFRNLRSPSAYVPARLPGELHWRLVAHAGLGLGSLARAEALRSLVAIEDPRADVDAQASRYRDLRVNSIREVVQRPEERVHRGSLVRGVGIDVSLDDRGFAGAGDAFVFGGILDRLFASAAPLNVFTITTVTLSPSNERFSFPARAGGRPLL